jgi:hypothetical protein
MEAGPEHERASPPGKCRRAVSRRIQFDMHSVPRDLAVRNVPEPGQDVDNVRNLSCLQRRCGHFERIDPAVICYLQSIRRPERLGHPASGETELPKTREPVIPAGVGPLCGMSVTQRSGLCRARQIAPGVDDLAPSFGEKAESASPVKDFRRC